MYVYCICTRREIKLQDHDSQNAMQRYKVVAYETTESILYYMID